MEGKNLIRKTETTSGHRRVYISITKEGRNVSKKAAPAAAKAYSHLLSPLKQEEQVMLIELLELLRTSLEDTSRAPMSKILREQ